MIAHIGAALTLFLATTDATIVSTALPTIAGDLTASQFQYTWVGVAYMLTQTAFQPLYGRISDLVGRKTILHVSILIFCIGSALCGAAQSIEWLIAARALAGIGGGGIVSAVWVITAEIVEERNRAKWSQALSITWSCSAIAGPLLGGAFSGQQGSGIISWRWGFYINLPICFFATVIISLALHNVQLARTPDASWKRLWTKFDFGGLILFMSGSSCLVIGFSFVTESGWTSPLTLTTIILGFLILIGAGFHERYTKRECLFPPTMFQDPTAAIVLVINFLHNLAFTAGTFYLALFFQAANGDSPLEAGIKLLPYSLGASLASMPVAWFIGYWQSHKHNTRGQNLAISVGLFVSTLGFGLLNLMNEHASITSQIIYPLVAGVGLGMLFHAPYQVFTKALKPSELATGTSAFFLVRFTGATIGLAIAGTIFYARSSANLPAGLPLDQTHSIDWSALSALVEPAELKARALQAVASAIQTIWTVCCPCLGFSFLISLLLRTMKINAIEQPSSATNKPAREPSEKATGLKARSAPKKLGFSRDPNFSALWTR
ncbi:MFS general substrate transporter [Coprinopsis marcescibilis]|uniref:MFS general substrate transporter n=1 Tax=Coprinopsis marcescibilis TaxID=230819 RepID=A0A5C3KIW7_COPMA|nr:MFS general substrate transporter [Coprinopsis marcescibilis]